MNRISAGLVPQGPTIFAVSRRLDPKAFFESCTGFSVSADFRSIVVANARPVEAGTQYRVGIADLTRRFTDDKIEAELETVARLFSETDVCGFLTLLIMKQVTGEEGELLNDGSVNLFYTQSCVVRVLQSAFSQYGLVVGARPRGDRIWSAGSRVFYLPKEESV